MSDEEPQTKHLFCVGCEKAIELAKTKEGVPIHVRGCTGRDGAVEPQPAIGHTDFASCQVDTWEWLTPAELDELRQIDVPDEFVEKLIGSAEGGESDGNN